MSYSLTSKQGGFLLSLDLHELEGPLKLGLHTHHELEISTVVEGTGRYAIGDRSYDLRPGDVILLNNIEPHGLSVDRDTTLRHLVIHFEPSFIWNAFSGELDYNFLSIFFERSDRFSNRLDRDNPATAFVASLMWDIRSELERGDPCCGLMVKIKLETIFATILRHFDYADPAKDAPLPSEYVPLLNEVCRYIDANLAQDIRLADLAAIVHVSPAYFSTLFKRFNLVTPVEYIVHRRVRRAVELLRSTDKTVTDIAFECGFNNGTNFYKAFRKVTGQTPSSFRPAAGGPG